jgi:chromosome segregation ATPase
MDGTPRSGESLEERLAAVERAVAEGEDREGVGLSGEATARVDSLEEDLADLTDRVAELEAATQALRGYVGNVRAVNDEVRERADAALATAEAVQETVEGSDGSSPRPGGEVSQARHADDGGGRDRESDPGHRCGRELRDAPTGGCRGPGSAPEPRDDRSRSLVRRFRDLL